MKQADLSPMKMNKEEFAEWISDYLEEGEYVKNWYIDYDDKLVFSIYIKEEDE